MLVMQRIILLIACISLLGATVTTTPLMAQGTAQKKTMSLGVYEALVVDFATAEDKLVADVWESFMDDDYDANVKYNRKTKEYLADDANIASLGLGNTVDLYVSIEEVGKTGSRFNLWVDLGANGFMSATQHPERYMEAEKIVMRFQQAVAKELVRLELEAQTKALDDMRSDLRKLESAKQRYEEDITRAEEAIRKAREAITENEAEQKEANERIEAQQRVIEQVQRRLDDMKRQ